MKKRPVLVAAAGVLTLTGCLQPVQFEAAPETMPAIESSNVPIPQTGVASWNTENIEYYGASFGLEELARKSARAVHKYSDENPDSPVAQLSFIESASEDPRNIVFTISNDLSTVQLKKSAQATACAIVEEIPGNVSDGAPWLGFLTLANAKTGERYMFSDTQLCQ